MANSENTFGDRLGRARALQAAIANFSPAFSPADALLVPAAFEALLNGIEVLNMTVANQSAAVSSVIASRASLMETIRQRTMQVVAFVKSNTTWKTHLPAVKQAGDGVLGYRPSKPAPAAPEAKDAKPKRKVGQQSYGDIDLLFERLIEAVKPIADYLPAPTSHIQKSQLKDLLDAYRTANADFATKTAALSSAQSTRLAAYEDETTGLRTKMKNIKEAVKGQYGSKSAEFNAVRGIRV